MKKNHYIYTLKVIPAIILMASTTVPAISQYYYKDLISLQQINDTYYHYKTNKVYKVALNSFQGNTPVTEGFICEQKINLTKNEVITYTKTIDVGESFLTAYYNPQGLLVKSIDSTVSSVSIATYRYDDAKRLQSIEYNTHATDNSSKLLETHFWQYNPSGKPIKMLRIKNNSDTTIVNFTLDEKANVTEEEISGKAGRTQKIYYYYNEKNQLTDVVRYQQKAKRLLPDYMFEYEDTGELSTLTIVPEGSSEYQKYFYKYDDNGLKLIEFCYNKKNELLGKVQYSYSQGK